MLRGRILSVGGAETLEIFFCIGTSDGGTNTIANWDRVIRAGANWTEDEDFELTVDGLQPETTYYYRCYATNSTGIAWSTAPLLSFSTSFRPSIVNLGAAPVNRWIWSLNGEVTNTGGETPNIWFHYWTGNGPTSVVYAGSSDGSFSAQVSSLEEDALYYFYARATNAAGAVRSTTNSFTTAPASANAIYVNPAATAPNTGASWARAYTNLQTAINAAPPDTVIYVSGGTVAHNAEVQIGGKKDIRIKGGYEGIVGTPGYHNPAIYPTRVIPTAATPTHRVFSIYNSTNIFIEDIEIAKGHFVHNNTVAAQCRLRRAGFQQRGHCLQAAIL